MGAMGSAISGMGAAQRWLDVISNNVSNQQTVAYKSGRVQFSDLVSQGLRPSSGASQTNNLGGVNPAQLGLGVQVSTVQNMMTQGATQITGNALDVAVQGEGFLTVEKGIETLYTRAGNLTIDNTGNVVTTDGGLVQGWTVQTTRTQTLDQIIVTNPVLNTSNPAAVNSIQIPKNLVLAPSATTFNTSPAIKDTGVIIKGNLDNRTPQNLSGAPGTAGHYADAVTTFVAYDSLGTPHTFLMTFQQTILNSPIPAPAQWTWYLNDITGNVPATAANQVGTGGPILFNGDGSLADNGNAGLNPTISIPLTNGAVGGGPIQWDFTLNLGTDNAFAPPAPGLRDGLTGDDGNGNYDPITGAYIPVQTVYTDFVQGYPEGTLTGVSIDQTGGINVSFSNNRTITYAKLAMTKFTNPEGLEKVGSNYFRKTANSGLGQVGTAGANGYGTTQGGALEQSNVELTVELTNMILAQRMFESNSRVVTAQDRVLDTLVNLGR